MPKISIVMPAYNVERYIRASIDSVLNQTFNDWELIIVNDGSTDGTLKIIEEYVAFDSRIKCVNQSNGGVSSARNKGLVLATGEFLSFLDSDDLYDVQYMEKMSAPLIENNADMSFCKFQELKDGQVILESPKDINQLVDNLPTHLLQVQNATHSMGMMYRLQMIKDQNIFFDESYSYGEDLEFVLKASCFAKVSFIPEYLYRYIYRGGSLSRRSIPYKDLLGELDSLRSLKLLVRENSNLDQQAYLKYFTHKRQGNLNNIRRYYWSLIKNREYDLLDIQLKSYENKYGQKFQAHYIGFKKYTDGLKQAIITSRSKLLWRIASLF